MALNNMPIRKFVIPKIDFNAPDYPSLFDWKTTKFSEPPLTTSLSNDEIRGLIQNPLKLPSFPCHTQAVERGIRVITEAATSVIGEDARDGFIRQKLKSRKDFGRCDSKAAFFPTLK